MARLGIIAGQGALPQRLAAAFPDALYAHLAEAEGARAGNDALEVSYERFGALFEGLSQAGVTEIVLAGALMRPALNPAHFDAKTLSLLPRILPALQQGDDALLRAVIALFEEEGFAVRGAHELVPDLTGAAGLLCGPAPGPEALADAARARAVLKALGPLDLGQAAVAAGGQILGIETLQGTDAMLRFVAQTAPGLSLAAKGVLVKAPKPGQDLRVDMPAIGPGTVAAALAAGLQGIVIDAGQVLLLEREALLAEAEAAGLFLLAEPPCAPS